MLWTRMLLNIGGLSFSRTRWYVKFPLEPTKLIKGATLITPEIGSCVFSCNKAFNKVAPKSCAMINVFKSRSQQFLSKVSISESIFLVG